MIALGSDHGGCELKERIKERLLSHGYAIDDFGCAPGEIADYPDMALKVANTVVSDKGYSFGLLFCGTGIGMSIAANKVRGIRAALCADTYSARMAREHNNANILVMGGRTLGAELAWEITRQFLEAGFCGGIHAQRVDALDAL